MEDSVRLTQQDSVEADCWGLALGWVLVAERNLARIWSRRVFTNIPLSFCENLSSFFSLNYFFFSF